MWARALDSLRRRSTAFGLAACSGLLYCLGFCGYDQDYLAWGALVPVLWALDDESLTRGEAAALGWTTGAVAHLGVYTWIIGLLRNFAFLPLPLALLGWVLLCLAQGSLFAAWGLGLHTLAQRRNVPLVWAAPVVMVLCEWLYPALFPSYFANSQYRRIALIQGCSLWGVLGLGFLLTLTSAWATAVLRWAVRRDRRWPLGATITTAALLMGTHLYGYGAIADLDDTLDHLDTRLNVGLVQTNMGIYEKSENPVEGLRRHRNQSMELQLQGAELIVWPESGYFYALDSATQNVKSQVLGPLHTPVLFGGLRLERLPTGRHIYNTAFLADAEGNVLGTYDKTYLLAFGEYLPGGDLLPWLYKLSPQTSHFDRGTRTAPLIWHGIRFGALICYEDILPGFVRGVMREKPDILVNITNDAWFGKTHEPRIHLALSVFRAVEQRRYLIRSTNTGISAIIDPAGRITQQTPVFARANLLGEVSPMGGTTFYQRMGDWPGWLCLVACALWFGPVWLRWARALIP